VLLLFISEEASIFDTFDLDNEMAADEKGGASSKPMGGVGSGGVGVKERPDLSFGEESEGNPLLGD
jgi:hypothetical protein